MLEARSSLQERERERQQARDQEAMAPKQVKISNETHELLGKLGEFGETYGDIIARITKHYASCPEARKEEKEKEKRLQQQHG